MKQEMGFLSEWTGLALASLVLIFMIALTVYEDSKAPSVEWADKYQRLLSTKMTPGQVSCLRAKTAGVETRHAKKLGAKKEIQAHIAQCQVV